MTERATAWFPVPDITDGFGSISFRYEYEPHAASSQSRSAVIVLNGERSLHLRFTGVIALHFEDECPGNFPLPRDRPRLNAQFMFPLLKIENSRWLAQWPMWPTFVHYALLSLDDLVHLIAEPKVQAHWKGP
jgi:hypothetical protein